MSIETIEDIPSLASYLDIKAAHQRNKDLNSYHDKINNLNLLDFEKNQVILSEKSQAITICDKDFSRIDLDPILKLRIWCKSLKMYVPKFAIYNIAHNKELIFKITDTYTSKNEEITIDMEDYAFGRYVKNYSDIRIISTIRKKFADDGDTIKQSIYHKFTGILSDDIRVKINDLCSNNNKYGVTIDSVYLIAESYHWAKSKVMTIPAPRPDPVVIFLKNGISYYLGSFDLTPPEKFITEMIG